MGKYIAVLSAVLAVFLGCVAPMELDDGAELNSAVLEGKKTMGLVPVGPAPGGPFTTILCPDDGNPATAEDHRREVSALLRNWEIQGNQKVDRAGDTMTGKLTINAPATNALELTTASTTLPALVVTGGGAAIVATGQNGLEAISATGSGSNPGLSAVGGASGTGINALPGTASTATDPTYALRLAAGGMHMDGVVSPNPDVDPGVDFALFPQNMVTARAFVTTGSGGDVLGGFNVASFARSAVGVGTITFARELPGDEYSLSVTPPDGYLAAENIAGRSTTQCQFVVRDASTNAVVDLTGITLKFSVTVTGY